MKRKRRVSPKPTYRINGVIRGTHGAALVIFRNLKTDLDEVFAIVTLEDLHSIGRSLRRQAKARAR